MDGLNALLNKSSVKNISQSLSYITKNYTEIIKSEAIPLVFQRIFNLTFFDEQFIFIHVCVILQLMHLNFFNTVKNIITFLNIKNFPTSTETVHIKCLFCVFIFFFQANVFNIDILFEILFFIDKNNRSHLDDVTSMMIQYCSKFLISNSKTHYLLEIYKQRSENRNLYSFKSVFIYENLCKLMQNQDYLHKECNLLNILINNDIKFDKQAFVSITDSGEILFKTNKNDLSTTIGPRSNICLNFLNSKLKKLYYEIIINSNGVHETIKKISSLKPVNSSDFFELIYVIYSLCIREKIYNPYYFYLLYNLSFIIKKMKRHLNIYFNNINDIIDRFKDWQKRNSGILIASLKKKNILLDSHHCSSSNK